MAARLPPAATDARSRELSDLSYVSPNRAARLQMSRHEIEPILKADGLSKRYEDGVLALDHLNLEVRPGEIYCLLGANGAGKTTTINLFLGFIPPTAGTCLINGIDVTKDPLEAKKYVVVRLRERHALRQFHGPPEPRLLRQARRQDRR